MAASFRDSLMQSREQREGGEEEEGPEDDSSVPAFIRDIPDLDLLDLL
jgi:hypothetical protein